MFELNLLVLFMRGSIYCFCVVGLLFLCVAFCVVPAGLDCASFVCCFYFCLRVDCGWCGCLASCLVFCSRLCF